MREGKVRHSEQGEVPAEYWVLGKEIMRDAIKKVRRIRKDLADDEEHEPGIRAHIPVHNGQPIILDERLDDLHFGHSEDGDNFLVRFKDGVKSDIAEHPLRDGIVLTVASVGLVGAGLYTRSKHKK